MTSWRKYRSLRDPQTLRRLVMSLREGIYITDEQGKLIDTNPAFLVMFGVTSMAELRSYRSADLMVDPAQREEELALLRRDGFVREFELRIRKLDGEERTVLDTAYAVTDPETGETLFHGMLVDITRHRKQERELRDLTIRDPLTGAFNREYLRDVERRLLGDGLQWGAIVVHPIKSADPQPSVRVGDQNRILLSRFLSQTARGDDAVFRMSGDVFVVVVAAAIVEATELVVDRLRDRAPLASPVSFTLAWARREGEESLAETIERADRNRDRDRIQVRVDTRRFERRLPATDYTGSPKTKNKRKPD